MYFWWSWRELNSRPACLPVESFTRVARSWCRDRSAAGRHDPLSRHESCQSDTIRCVGLVPDRYQAIALSVYAKTKEGVPTLRPPVSASATLDKALRTLAKILLVNATVVVVVARTLCSLTLSKPFSPRLNTCSLFLEEPRHNVGDTLKPHCRQDARHSENH